jgi:hypothetical protein
MQTWNMKTDEAGRNGLPVYVAEHASGFYLRFLGGRPDGPLHEEVYRGNYRGVEFTIYVAIDSRDGTADLLWNNQLPALKAKLSQQDVNEVVRLTREAVLYFNGYFPGVVKITELR